MLDDLVTWARVCITVAAIFMLFCRLTAMDKTTPRRIAWQHEQLACVLVMSLVVPRHLADLLLVAGVAVYLGLGASRWRHGPPYLADDLADRDGGPNP